MKSFLCRVMTLVFLFNCLTPASGWGQTSRRKKSTHSLDAQVTRKVAKAEQDNSPAAQFVRADQEVRNAHNEQFAQVDTLAAQERKKRALQVDGTAVAGSTRVVRPPVSQPLPISSAKDFLAKLSNNEIPFEQLIEYADPMDPSVEKNDLLMITYATEILGNTISQTAQLDSTQYDLNEFEKYLPQIEARLLYRMALLGFKAPSYSLANAKEPVSVSRTGLQQSYGDSIQKTMAVGTLRMALLKIHQYYQAQGKKDPVDEYQKQMLAQRIKASAQKTSAVPEQRRNQLKAAPSAQMVAQRAEEGLRKHGNLADFQSRFLNELKQLKNQKPEAGTVDFQHLQILAEYATAYSLEYNPNNVREIVKIFDEGVERNARGQVKPGNYQRDYAPILNAVLSTVFENTRYSCMGTQQTKQVFELLTEFSDPEKYSLPTRIFALEAASLLYRPFNYSTLNASHQPIKVFEPLNLALPDENLRKLFAQRVVELYCPLTNESTFGVQDYGLDSKQMQTLADKLAYIYDGFYDISTTTISMPGQNPHQHTNQCVMTLKNRPNRAKKNAEDSADFFWWTANTLFFVFGGETFQLLGTAFRLTRGAVVALPKAGRAFKMAQNGEKIAAFNKTVREGAKYANWVIKNKKNQARLVTLFVEEKVPGAVTEIGNTGAEAVVQTVTKEVQAGTTHALRNQSSLWNYKRWFGLDPQRTVTGMRITELRPGFQTNVYEAHWDAKAAREIFGRSDLQGLESWSDIEKAMAQLRNVVDDTPFQYTVEPFWQGILNTGQAYMERSLAESLYGSLEAATDTWVPLVKKADVTMARIAGKTAQNAAKDNVHWWNLSWGKPPKGYDNTQWTNVFISPKGKWDVIENASKLQAQGGMLNAPSQLPGFFTSYAEVAQGKLGQQTFDAFFKSMNWQTRGVNGVVSAQQAGANANRGWQHYKNLAKQTFLPDYIPTATFWKFVKESPTVFGTRMLPKLLYRSRFVNTTGFFAAWSGLDYGAYPVFEGWLVKEQTKDAQAELAKYGDAFDPQRAKMDELLAQELGAEPKNPREQSIQDSYSNVVGNPRKQSDGTTISAPIILARRAMGMEFLDEATKQAWAQYAHRADLNHATLQRTHKIVEQNKKVEAQNEKDRKQLRQNLVADEQQVLATYALGFSAIPGSKEKLHRAYETYTQAVLSARTEDQVTAAKKRFDQQAQSLLTQAATYQSCLQEGEDLIKTARAQYAQNPGLFTAKAEKQIRAIYKAYAQELLALPDMPEDQAKTQLLNAMFTRESALNQLWNELFAAYEKNHPEFFEEEASPEYGPNFDPNAGN